MKRCVAGLTLIEVLVALAIISIALTAIIKATTQSVRATAYLKHKTMALWIAQEALSEARLQLIKLPTNNQLTTVTTVLGEVWYWQGLETKTANVKIKKYQIEVFDRDPNEGSDPLITLEGYQS